MPRSSVESSPNTLSRATVALHTACRSGNLDAVNQALADGASVHEQDAEGYNAMLHFACCRRRDATMYTAVLDRLLEAGATLDARSPDNDPATHVAASEQRWWLVDLLIRRGASLTPIFDGERKAYDKAGYHSILSWAVQRGPLNTVRLLLDHGAQVDDASIDGHTALGLAVWTMGPLENPARARQMMRIVDLLLERGASILGAPGEDLWASPLAIAVLENSTTMLHRLLDAGAWRDEPRWTVHENQVELMRRAVDEGRPDALVRLVKEGVGQEWPHEVWDHLVERAQEVMADPEHPILPISDQEKQRRTAVLSVLETQQLRRTLDDQQGTASPVVHVRERL